MINSNVSHDLEVTRVSSMRFTGLPHRLMAEGMQSERESTFSGSVFEQHGSLLTSRSVLLRGVHSVGTSRTVLLFVFISYMCKKKVDIYNDCFKALLLRPAFIVRFTSL